jgi:hypothetical protein
LPTQLFNAEFLRLKAVTPENISDFARKAGVSIQALLWRLDKSNSLFIKRYFRGCVVLIEQSKSEMKIRAIAKPRSFNIARQLSLMRPGEIWKLRANDGSEINPTALPPTSLATLAVETAMSKSQQLYKIRFAKVGNFDGVKSYLVTFEEA